MTSDRTHYFGDGCPETHGSLRSEKLEEQVSVVVSQDEHDKHFCQAKPCGRFIETMVMRETGHCSDVCRKLIEGEIDEAEWERLREAQSAWLQGGRSA